MADLNKIQAAEAVVICDGVSQDVAVGSSIPTGSEYGLVVRDAIKGQQTMANSRPVVIASDQSDIGINIDKYGGTATTLGQKTMANSIPVTMASNQTSIPVQISPGNNAAAASTAAFTNNYRLFDFQFLGQDNRLIWYESTSGSGASTFSTTTNELNMNLTTTNGDQVIRQSQRIIGQSGASNIWLVGCTIGAKKTNVRQRIGAFDTNDGYFFEQDGTNLKVVTRTSISGSPVDTAVNQSSWNVDKLDGTGVSGITLNTAFHNDYFVSWNFDYILFGIIINGIAYYCHQVSFHNSQTDDGFSTRNFPVRIEITNTGTAASGTSLLLSTAAAYASGGTLPFSIVRSVDLGVTGKTIPATLTPMISLRLKSANVRNKLIVNNFNIILSSSQSVYLALVFNSTLTGASFATTPGTNTISEYDTAATAISGGDVIWSGYASGSGQGNIQSTATALASLLAVSSNIAGTSDIITLAGQKTGGTSPTAFIGMQYNEFI